LTSQNESQNRNSPYENGGLPPFDYDELVYRRGSTVDHGLTDLIATESDEEFARKLITIRKIRQRAKLGETVVRNDAPQIVTFIACMATGILCLFGPLLCEVMHKKSVIISGVCPILGIAFMIGVSLYGTLRTTRESEAT
jgi:hypothetical protein